MSYAQAMTSPTYLTPAGLKGLTDQLTQLLHVDRPRTVRGVADAAADGDRSENAEYIYGKKRLREIDRRIRFLTKRLDHVVVVEPGATASDQVRFGATVTVQDESDQQRVYQLVGPDEARPSDGLISFHSPLGRALLKRRVGDAVTVRRPIGDIELEIIEITYQ